MQHNHQLKRVDGHAKFMMEKRQRVATTAADPEEETSVAAVRTTARGRQPLSTTAATDDDADIETTATSVARGRARPTTTAVDDDDTLPTLALTRNILPTASTVEISSSATPSTTAVRTTAARVVTPTTTPITLTRTPLSLSSSSTATSSTPSTISVSSGIAAIPAQSADASASESNNSGGGSHAGAIAGAIIAVIAVAAIAAFFGLRYRKKKQQAAEDAAIFPYGGNAGNGGASGASTGAAAGAFGKRQSAGYSQQIDSHDDIPATNHNNGYYGEKETMASEKMSSHPPAAPSSGMAGYGTLSLNGGMNNFAGRGSGFSASNASLLGRDGAPLQPGSFVSPGLGGQQDRFSNGGNGFNDYPPTPLQNQNNHASMQSFGSAAGRPSAAMMSHLDDPLNRSINHLPAHQDQALSAALAAASTVPLPNSPAMTGSRQSMNSVAAAAAGAALGGGGRNSMGEPQAGPFEDPSHEGKLYVVTRIFEPSMPDELVIFPGDRIQIVVTYDDGWCLGCNLDSSKRDGKPPARGVFPVDCVEELLPPSASRPASQQTLSQRAMANSARNSAAGNLNADEPISNGTAILHRAPTLPPLDMGMSSRFSMSSSPASARPSEEQKRMSKRQSTARIPETHQIGEEEEEMDDAYGGVANANSATPTHTAFPPDIQVSQPAPLLTSNNSNRLSHQFGSSQHIADYASQLGDNSNKRLSTLDEENSQIIDEFPSTPRTTQPDSPMTINEARLSVLGTGGMPKSSSSKSLNRTSSLIASKDADLFLALGDALDKH